MGNLTQAYVRHLFDYDPLTGVLTWRVRPKHSRMRVGSVAGSDHSRWGIPNRRVICIGFTKYTEADVIWLWMTGAWPTRVDHADLNPFNNRWNNLREATNSDNNCNQRNKRIGRLKWAYITKEGNYQSKVQKHGIVYNLGTYPTEQEAHDVAYARAQQLHKQFVRRT